MDSHPLLVRTVATLARRQIALEALLQGKGISKEDIAEAAGQVPIPQINPTYSPLRWHYQRNWRKFLGPISSGLRSLECGLVQPEIRAEAGLDC